MKDIGKVGVEADLHGMIGPMEPDKTEENDLKVGIGTMRNPTGVGTKKATHFQETVA